MSETFQDVKKLVAKGNIKISEHGYDELAEDGIFVKDIIAGVNNGILIEDYPEYPKGPCSLILQRDRDKKPVHVVWGIPRDENSPAVLITAYRPDLNMWNKDFTRRRK